MTSERHRVAIVFPADAKGRFSPNVQQSRFADIAQALCAAGIEVVGAPYADEFVEELARCKEIIFVVLLKNP